MRIANVRLIESDYGTPPNTGTGTVRLEIDGVRVETVEGTSIMRAASEVGISIPKLCATDSLRSFGSCRMCMVEVEGRPGFRAACTEPVGRGMQVRTQSEAIARQRRGTMELYISDHPLDCLTCSANGDCELQDVAGAVGLREVRYQAPATHLDAEVDGSNPYFDFDPTKCIVCSRCVRACNEVQGTFALTVLGRGFDSVIATGAKDFCLFRLRVLRRLRAGLPDGDADGEVRGRARDPGPHGADDLRLLRCGLLAQGRAQGRPGHSHGAVQGRQGQPRARLRQGPLRLGLREPQGPHHHAHDPRHHRPALARGVVGGSDRVRRCAPQGHPGRARQVRGRRHHLVSLHQRGGVAGDEAGPRGLRQQQRRHLCPCLPLADGLRAQADLRHVGGDPALRFRRRAPT